MSEWQPGSVPPMSGIDVLVWTGGEFAVAYYVQSNQHQGWTTGWETVAGYDAGYAHITVEAWMPLPTPPITNQSEAEGR